MALWICTCPCPRLIPVARSAPPRLRRSLPNVLDHPEDPMRLAPDEAAPLHARLHVDRARAVVPGRSVPAVLPLSAELHAHLPRQHVHEPRRGAVLLSRLVVRRRRPAHEHVAGSRGERLGGLLVGEIGGDVEDAVVRQRGI